MCHAFKSLKSGKAADNSPSKTVKMFKSDSESNDREVRFRRMWMADKYLYQKCLMEHIRHLQSVVEWNNFRILWETLRCDKRDHILSTLEAMGEPDKIISIFKRSYKNAKCRVLHDGTVRQTFITSWDLMIDIVESQNIVIYWDIREKVGDTEYVHNIAVLLAHLDTQAELNTN